MTTSLSLPLRCRTPERWAVAIAAAIDQFLPDHAACERKAAATGMSFVARYPDRPELVAAMIAFAREELEHLQLVHKHMMQRGLVLGPDEKDPYLGALRKRAASHGEARLCDHLLLAAVVEARGCERFAMLGEVLDDASLQTLYRRLGVAEARHAHLFVQLAERYFTKEDVQARLTAWLDMEAEIIAALPLRLALH
ncbi:MAG: tRNA-(ms[2]io[6]A)-hydroxylase [Polyangiales bacterium]